MPGFLLSHHILIIQSVKNIFRNILRKAPEKGIFGKNYLKWLLIIITND